MTAEAEAEAEASDERGELTELDRHAVHFSSESDDWTTPGEFFAGVFNRFGPFDLDPAADASNALAPMWWGVEDDGLCEPWIGRVWCNPPYGRGIRPWVQKCAETAWSGAACVPGHPETRSQVVALLPARTDTQWWHRWVMRSERVYLVEGRLKFGGAVNGAPFPSALVVWGPELKAPVFGAMDRRGRVGPWRNVCQRCAGPYRSKRPVSFYCSPKCRQAAQRARRRLAGSPEPGPE